MEYVYLVLKELASDIAPMSYSAKKELANKAIEAAQQSVQWTAFAAGSLGLIAGVIIGFIIGGR